MTDTASRPDGYPAEWEADVVLRDGSVAHVRPIVPDDGDGLRRFHAGQSAESIYLRFFAPLKTLSDKDVARFTQVFNDAGYEVNHHFDNGVIAVAFEIEPTAQSLAVRQSREHRAEAVSMHSVLFPASIAVIGASRRTDSIGHRLLQNILAGGFKGRVHAVNTEALEVAGLQAHSRVTDIPDHVDLAVVAVPAESVIEVVNDCAAAGVKALLVVSAGFAESSTAGEQLQVGLLQTARNNGMRVIGPNSFGIINSHPDVRMNASLAPVMPPAGTLGLFSQSGALGIAVLASA